jgi:L-cystine uptake protein TcyP (sodium:dicarboxylate symporter family)
MSLFLKLKVDNKLYKYLSQFFSAILGIQTRLQHLNKLVHFGLVIHRTYNTIAPTTLRSISSIKLEYKDWNAVLTVGYLDLPRDIRIRFIQIAIGCVFFKIIFTTELRLAPFLSIKCSNLYNFKGFFIFFQLRK